MPSCACSSGEALVTSAPLKRIEPAVGDRSPAMQLKKVDLPAPFGPIRPTISLALTARLASLRARKPPKARLTLSTSSSTRRLRFAPDPRDTFESRPDRMPQLDHAAGLEPRQQHDDAAVDDVGQAAAAAAEPGVGRTL